MKRTRSMELRALRTGMDESPPPAPAGTSVREWFAGLALANPELMKDVPSPHRAKEAVRLADELMDALLAPRLPTQESMEPPSDEEMEAWDKHVADNIAAKERQSKVTCPEGLKAVKPPAPPSKTRTMEFGAVLFSPPPSTTLRPPPMGRRSGLPEDTRYSLNEPEVQDVLPNKALRIRT